MLAVPCIARLRLQSIQYTPEGLPYPPRAHPELGLPDGLIEASDGNLYGTADGAYHTGYHGYSSIFRISPSTAKFETVFPLKDARLGACPCHLVQGTDGKIYGAASNLGMYEAGTIFCARRAIFTEPPTLAVWRTPAWCSN